MSLVLRSSGGGSVTLSEPTTASTRNQNLADVDGTLAPLVSGTAVASTSGTSVDFANVIPSWAKRFTVMFNGVSTTGTSNLIIQLGTGPTPTYVTSGYTGSCAQYNGGSTTLYTTGFLLAVSGANSNTYYGVATFSAFGGNTWFMQSSLGRSDGANGVQGAGALSAGAAVTSIRITTAGGTDTFDAGSINIMWE